MRWSRCQYCPRASLSFFGIHTQLSRRSTGKDALLETAMALHDAAMKDEYFIKRRLAPNVDFWYVACTIYFATVAHSPLQEVGLDGRSAGVSR